MASYLCIAARAIDSPLHARHNGDPKEWPPSPLQLFQALLAAAARRFSAPMFKDTAWPALIWLEERQPPIIVAPAELPKAAYQLARGAHNSLPALLECGTRPRRCVDRSARAPAPMADITLGTQPSTGSADSDCPVYYLWALPSSLPPEVRSYLHTLSIVSGGMVALGRAVDLVAGRAQLLSQAEADRLPGQRWLPSADQDGSLLPVPTRGTLSALKGQDHATFHRLPAGGGFRPAPPLSVFTTVAYQRTFDPPSPPLALFHFLREDTAFPHAFDPAREGQRLVGMIRRALCLAAQAAGWPTEKIAAMILGHGEQPGTAHQPVCTGRFAYLPLPTLPGAGPARSRAPSAARRLLLTAFGPDCQAELAWARQALCGRELVNHRSRRCVAILSLLPLSDRLLASYIPRQPASTWATVTPVILPGRDDRLKAKTELLIRKAIRQAGFPDELACHARIACCPAPFWPGVDQASAFRVPPRLRVYPRYHVQITWCDRQGRPVLLRGPICLGSGRFCGLGLFAAAPT